MELKILNFKMVLNISAWIFLGLTGIWGIAIIGPIDLDVKNAVILLFFLIMTISSFGIHSYILEYPENQDKYFIEWLITFIILCFIAFSVYVFA
ncbi:MAG: hypothetical protein ACTSQO_11100 [Candidatus Helarchaeota archaeon]